MRTPDIDYDKALGVVAPRFKLLEKTEDDVVWAALPKLDQEVLTQLKDHDEFEPGLVNMTKALGDMQKEAGKFLAGWHEAQERVKTAKELLDGYNLAQTVDEYGEQLATHGVRIDGLDEQFVTQNNINEEVQQDLSFNAREHNALKGRVQRTEQDVGKLEGEQGMAKNVIDTMRERDAAMAHQQSEKDREWRQEIREAAKWETQANAKKMEADAMEQERDEWKAKCEATVAQKEVLLATIAEQQRDNAVLEAQLKHKKEDAAELARARREVEAAKQRESDRKEREAKDRRKSAEAAKEVAAQARAKTMAAELERDTVRRENDALVIKVKELDARVRTADERAATLVEGATRERLDLANADNVSDFIRRATQSREVAETIMNVHSSRSDMVLRIHTTCTHAGQHVRLRGELDLVDLAGSERLARSGSTDADRLEEAKKINSSLTSLGKTIRELADKKARPSYEKALTKLLRPALSAGGKTLLIVNVSPTVASAHETKESLRFAQDAKKVKLGEASRDVDRA